MGLWGSPESEDFISSDALWLFHSRNASNNEGF